MGRWIKARLPGDRENGVRSKQKECDEESQTLSTQNLSGKPDLGFSGQICGKAGLSFSGEKASQHVTLPLEGSWKCWKNTQNRQTTF